MRKILLFTFFIVLFSLNYAQPSGTRGASNSQMVLSLDHKEYDFGNIKEGTKIAHSFTLTNNGSSEVYILDVETGCNCTSSDYPFDAIAPGEKAVINVVFDSAGKVGTQLKKILIVTDKGNLSCKLFGTVFPKNKNY
ncbi:MAG: DUF1573 domain-containing protein [Bacteroidia bacterium]|nr:DUF1573 domain-containing protein [Bacteroidia bacterium]